MELQLTSLVPEEGICICGIPPAEQDSNYVVGRIWSKITFYSTLNSSGQYVKSANSAADIPLGDKKTSELAAPFVFPCPALQGTNPASIRQDGMLNASIRQKGML